MPRGANTDTDNPSVASQGNRSRERSSEFKDACVLFPCSLLNPKLVDEYFAEEYEAVRSLGLSVALGDDSSLRDQGSSQLKLRNLHEPNLFYRGWMLSEQEFRRLDNAAQAADHQLLTGTDEYLQAHYLTNWYAAFSDHTPYSVWGDPDLSETLLEQMPEGGAIVKDFVKSLKHLWDKACYIPDVRDLIEANKVISEFKELRQDIQGGLIIRQYEPLGDEYRSWWRDGRCRLISAHPDTPDLEPPEDLSAEFLTAAVDQLSARLITIDLAQNTDTGKWRVVEVGDGMVSDRPQGVSPQSFYTELFLAE